MRDFRELKVWDKAHQLTLAVYKVTATFPREELFGLTSKTRRACASIPANIAEGCSRKTNNELAHLLQIAAGSASELDYHLLLAHDLKMLNKSDYETLSANLADVRRMLSAFIKNLAQ